MLIYRVQQSCARIAKICNTIVDFTVTGVLIWLNWLKLYFREVAMMRSFVKSSLLLSCASTMALTASACARQDANAEPILSNAQVLASVDERRPEDEIIYFVLPDRFENGDTSNDTGGIEGGVIEHGFNPEHQGFYQGGDLQGLTQRLDYIEGLGVTAIWLTPIFQNKAVQGGPGFESAGYHGYWITDFYGVDQHLGGREAFAGFVEAAHARGMKVYMDIITNHTADVAYYRECHDPEFEGFIDPQGGCPYRSKAEYPWTTRGDAGGEPINQGFRGDDTPNLTEENYAQLSDPNWAYTVAIDEEEADVRNPAWLNDPLMYHNRGESFWYGESSFYGDFAGLDDLNTEHPQVVEGMIEIYKQWITDFRVDGFRIDTVKHVRPEFWAQFNTAIVDHAHSLGIDHFHVFGEIYEFDAGRLGAHTVESQLPATLDFAFQSAARSLVANGEPSNVLSRLYEFDPAYADGFKTAKINPTFLGNHDMGRFSMFLRQADESMDDAEMLSRLRLAHGLMMFTRGVPTIYYGDEQGFVSDYNDQGARESMFSSVTPIYIDNDQVGTDATPADNNFDTEHPLYQAIADMAAVRTNEPALRRGAQYVRVAEEEGGLFVISRIDEESGVEVVAAFNADETARTGFVEVDGLSMNWTALSGECGSSSSAPGSYEIEVPALDFIVCRSQR
jgi:glycosidase